MVTSAEGYAIGDDTSNSLQIGDGNALTPIGLESLFLTLSATDGVGCTIQEVDATLTHATTTLDGKWLNDITLTDAVGMPGFVFFSMACRSCCSRGGCCLRNDVSLARYTSDEVNENVRTTWVPVAKDDIGSFPTVGHEGVGALVGIIRCRAEASCLEHLMKRAIDWVMPRTRTLHVAVLVTKQCMVTKTVHLFGLGVADRTSVRVTIAG